MCNAHVVVTVSAAANAFAATLDRFSCRATACSRTLSEWQPQCRFAFVAVGLFRSDKLRTSKERLRVTY